MAAKGVVETATRVREGGISGLLVSSIEDIARWVTEDRATILRNAAPDGTVTIFFSDIEDSTIHNELGDDEWVRLLGDHDRIVREQSTSPRPKQKPTTTTQSSLLRPFRWQNPPSTEPGAVQPGPTSRACPGSINCGGCAAVEARNSGFRWPTKAGNTPARPPLTILLRHRRGKHPAIRVRRCERASRDPSQLGFGRDRAMISFMISVVPA